MMIDSNHFEIDLQFFGGRGSSSSSGGGGTGGIDASDILGTRSLISEREGNAALVDETLSVFRDVQNEYGAQVTDIQLATIKPGTPAIAYYDWEGNTAINEMFFNEITMNAAYKQCVDSGFHPKNGSKTALQAVVAHELGHKLTADIGTKLGMDGFGGLDQAANKVVSEAMATTKHKSSQSFASKISGYATHNNAETIAEAFCDVYCNGKKARSESKAIVKVIDKYLK